MVINFCNKIISAITKKTVVMQFIMYCTIGVVNTIVGFLAFYWFFLFFNKQSISLFLATLVGVMCSYYLNSKFNFKTKISFIKYIVFVMGMLTIGYISGYIGDFWQLPLVVTFFIQTLVGISLGFLFSKYIVFKA